MGHYSFKYRPVFVLICLTTLLLSICIGTQEANKCSKSNNCGKCTSNDVCAWCTSQGQADGTCMYKSQVRYLCDGMKDTSVVKGYGCPNSVLDGGSAGPKREDGFGASNRTENIKKFKERTRNIYEKTLKSTIHTALLHGINAAHNAKIRAKYIEKKIKAAVEMFDPLPVPQPIIDAIKGMVGE
jgi:hypothetical protein